MSLSKAKNHLLNNDVSIVVVKNNEVVFQAKERGIKPIFNLFTENRQLLHESYVADKVIGRGAAMFLVEAGVRGIYGQLMSRQALDVCQDSLEIEYGKATDYIMNRDKTGTCPVESISMKVDTIESLTEDVRAFLDSLK